ncbi:MAG: hypothetical protein SAL07_06750 [Oscillatoria sp. PMC 1051.18]|nr:hypothetical protein [Oscillatoria sp. PMC 1050.18]MEC5029595.1 hypothetical protein [Oscillatoria sp. PMC 1051.18]NET89009.1 hypothetical protein [Kamptonema sp. SIO1D9]
MPVKQSHYEVLLSEYSNREAAIALLREYRPYLEMLPSMRRPDRSVISIPLPVARIRQPKPTLGHNVSVGSTGAAIPLECDIALLMCDPEWKIKMGVEILIFIHRPQEDFSGLLRRWRQTQVSLDKDYEWLMPPGEQHMVSEGAEQIYPLFVVFAETPERIKRGLAGASLPFVVQTPDFGQEEEFSEALFAEG